MNINWGGPGYAEYQGWMKVSSGEKTAANLQASESQLLQGWMQTQFGEQQGWLNNVIMPQLQHMATNPPGFGLPALSAMRSRAISTIGGQLESQQRALQNQFATQNMAGLGSGVQAALGANLAQGAAGQEASALQNIAIANAQAQMQQQQFGLSGLMGGVQQLGQVPGSTGALTTSLGNQFSQQYNMAQQGGFWSNLARGALTAAGGALGGMAGGPWGAMAGANIGASVGGGFAGGGGQPMQMQTG